MQMQCERGDNADRKLCNSQVASGIPGGGGTKSAAQVEIKLYYVIMRETLAHKSIYNQFMTTTTTVDKIINMNVLKAPQKAKD